MVVQVALDADKGGVALSARVGICQLWINDPQQWVINDSKIDRAKNIFHSIGKIFRLSRLIPLVCPAGKIVLCLHRN